MAREDQGASGVEPVCPDSGQSPDGIENPGCSELHSTRASPQDPSTRRWALSAGVMRAMACKLAGSAPPQNPILRMCKAYMNIRRACRLGGHGLKRSGHGWSRVFWLGFPGILGLLWIYQNVPHILSALALCGVTLAWILHGVRSVSRSAPTDGLLDMYARVHVSLGFAALVMVGLFVVATLGTVWYLFALALWLGFHLLARAFVAWLTPKQGQATPARSTPL